MTMKTSQIDSSQEINDELKPIIIKRAKVINAIT